MFLTILDGVKTLFESINEDTEFVNFVQFIIMALEVLTKVQKVLGQCRFQFDRC